MVVYAQNTVRGYAILEIGGMACAVARVTVSHSCHPTMHPNSTVLRETDFFDAV